MRGRLQIVKSLPMNSSNWPWISDESIRFDRFMDLALHDPQRGYYARRIRGVGHSGDFTTTPMLTPSLGKAVAAWAAEAMKSSDCRHLIELGPGEGKLAQAVMRNLPWWTRVRSQFHLVETSTPLRGKQRELLGSGVRWHASVEAALEVCGGKACIYSNEFADAFAVRRFRREESGWSELHVSPAEQWLPCDGLPDSSVFDVPHPPGQQVEVAEAFHQWLAGMMPHWKAGRMLTIDYGSEIGALYHRRPRGSIRAYFMQQRLEGAAIYQNPGRQDLTADVNFTDLQRWPGSRMETVALCTQREFLRPWADPSDAADAHAIDPHGAGGAFMILDQRLT